MTRARLLAFFIFLLVLPLSNAALLRLNHGHHELFEFQHMQETIYVHEDGQGYDGHLKAYIWVNKSYFDEVPFNESNQFVLEFSPSYQPRDVVENLSFTLNVRDVEWNSSKGGYNIANSVLIFGTLPEPTFYGMHFEANYTVSGPVTRTLSPHEYRLKLYSDYEGPYELTLVFPQKFRFSYAPEDASYTPGDPHIFTLQRATGGPATFVYHDSVALQQRQWWENFAWVVLGALLGAVTTWSLRRKKS